MQKDRHKERQKRQKYKMTQRQIGRQKVLKRTEPIKFCIFFHKIGAILYAPALMNDLCIHNYPPSPLKFD